MKFPKKKTIVIFTIHINELYTNKENPIQRIQRGAPHDSLQRWGNAGQSGHTTQFSTAVNIPEIIGTISENKQNDLNNKDVNRKK